MNNIFYRILSFIFLLTSFIPVLFWNRLIETKIPVHFNFAGEPDRWGDGVNIFLLPLFSCVLYVLMSCAARNPQLINYPMKVSKDERMKFFPYLVPCIQSLNVVLMIFLSYLSNGALIVGLGYWKTLPVVPLYTFLGLIVLFVVVFYWKILSLRKRMKRNS